MLVKAAGDPDRIADLSHPGVALTQPSGRLVRSGQAATPDPGR